jgi:maleate cis-trans isomerase
MIFSRRAIVLLVLLRVLGFAQITTTLNLSTQGRNADFSKFPFTRPLTLGSSLPSTCQVGQLFFNTAAPGGTNVYACPARDTWTAVGSGNNYTLPQASSTTLGGVMIGSGLAIASGALSVNLGTVTGSVAAGDDSRIIGALQSGKNLSDVANAVTVLQNLRLAGANPLSISAPTTGNAATATRLLAAPTGCAAGQYATGMATSGNALCAQVQYSQIISAPSAYTLPEATTTAIGGVMVGSGLAVSSGTLSTRFGTVAGTVAAGNDSRIANSLQTANNLADVANLGAVLQNLKLTGANSATLTSSTQGNAATATSLQGTGALQILGGTGSPPTVGVGQLGVWFDSADLNLHLRDINSNQSTLIRTSSGGSSTDCDASSFVRGFQSNGVPNCGSLSAVAGKIGVVSSSSTIVGICGTSPVLSGSDSAGIVVAGGGTVTACTVTFSSPFANPPICTANDNSQFLVIKPSANTAKLTLSAQSSFGGDALSYICIGK